MTEFELFQALKALYPTREYAVLPQTANGTGYSVSRHCDALALSLWPSRGLHLSGFEIKSYRGDWLREKANPEKADAIARYCNYWWIVAANDKIATAEEMPEPWGLLVYDSESNSLEKRKPARFNEATPLDLPMMAAILRKTQETKTPLAALSEAEGRGYERGKQEGRTDSEYDRRQHEELTSKLAIIKKQTGIDLATWLPAEYVATAINTALNSDTQKHIESLRRIARKIREDYGLEEDEPLPKVVPARRRGAV